MKSWKGLAATVIVGAVGLPTAALSNGVSGEDFVVEAPVIDVKPLVSLVEVSTPQEVCWDEPVYGSRHRHHSPMPSLAGGIIGGVIGNMVGGGRGSRRALTAVGAILGASMGHNRYRHYGPPPHGYGTMQRICRVEQVGHQEERMDGYRVTYEYRGRHFVTHTSTHPGATIPVAVSVQPAADDTGDRPGRYSSREHRRDRRYGT